MSKTPHAFFRFLNQAWMQEVCNEFRTDLRTLPAVRLHGDAHVEQYAVTANARGLDDFDDSAVGPAIIDLVRFLGSAEITAYQQGWSQAGDAAASELVRGYRRALQDPTHMPAVIVFNHGYIPPDQYRTTERYIAYVDWLARSGYVVFRIDYRGHDRSEGVANGAYGSPDYTADVLNAVAALQAFPQADPQRIGMWGHSMGGYLTLRAMVISPDVKAGVIWAGVVASYPDLLTRWRRGSGRTPTPPFAAARRWRSEWIELYGTPEQNPDFWKSVSANSYLADLSGPLQLHHGTADESVPLEFSEPSSNSSSNQQSRLSFTLTQAITIIYPCTSAWL